MSKPTKSQVLLAGSTIALLIAALTLGLALSNVIEPLHVRADTIREAPKPIESGKNIMFKEDASKTINKNIMFNEDASLTLKGNANK